MKHMSGKQRQRAVADPAAFGNDDDDEATMASPQDSRYIAGVNLGVNRQALPNAQQHQVAVNLDSADVTEMSMVTWRANR